MQIVAEIMDADPVTVGVDATLEEVVRKLQEHDVNGLPVVNAGGRCVGMITEADLVIGDEEGDLHGPHYIEFFGGLIFLEGMRHFEERLKKATAARAQDLMTEDPVTIGPEATAKPRSRGSERASATGTSCHRRRSSRCAHTGTPSCSSIRSPTGWTRAPPWFSPRMRGLECQHRARLQRTKE